MIFRHSGENGADCNFFLRSAFHMILCTEVVGKPSVCRVRFGMVNLGGASEIEPAGKGVNRTRTRGQRARHWLPRAKPPVHVAGDLSTSTNGWRGARPSSARLSGQERE